MPLTLISHFWDEEFLLPYWVRHHLPLFDRAVLLDYASTDRSVEIVRDLAPRWEVRPSRNRWFAAQAVDQEVMEVEQEFSGWKVVLNTTEFLVCADLQGFVHQLEERRPSAAGVWAFDLTLVDHPRERDEVVTAEPLCLQRRWGFHSGGTRSRLLHRLPTGNYRTGRHHSDSIPKQLEEGLFLAWFGWCPWRYVKGRKLKIQERIPPQDRADGFGVQHFTSEEELESSYRHHAGRIYDLWQTHPRYRESLRSAGEVV